MLTYLNGHDEWIRVYPAFHRAVHGSASSGTKGESGRNPGARISSCPRCAKNVRRLDDGKFVGKLPDESGRNIFLVFPLNLAYQMACLFWKQPDVYVSCLHGPGGK